jgi:hypothetical protein
MVAIRELYKESRISEARGMVEQLGLREKLEQGNEEEK